MSLINTRIELHQANYQDYVNLHSYMAQEGYKTTIRGDNSSTYHLPTAEYNLVANCTIAQALDKAQRAAQKTRKRFAAVVSEYTSCSWLVSSRCNHRAPHGRTNQLGSRPKGARATRRADDLSRMVLAGLVLN
jgi:hypothetical protein